MQRENEVLWASCSVGEGGAQSITHTYKHTHTYNTHKYTRVHTHIHTHTCKYFHQNLDSLGFELDEDDMAKIAALDRNFHYLRPNDWYGIPLFCP